MKKQLKTIEEMNEMKVNDLDDYAHELYMLWSQSNKILAYRREMESDKILLNSTNVVDVKMLTNNEEEE